MYAHISRVSYRIFGLGGGGEELLCNEVTQYLAICDPLWENRPNHRLLQNKIEALKVYAVIIVVGGQIFQINNLNPHYFLNFLVKFYRVQALRKW